MATTTTIEGHFLVQGCGSSNRQKVEKNVEENQDDDDDNEEEGYENSNNKVYPILASDVPLSFWGGIDEKTSVVIDTTHPLAGHSVKDTILCLPSARGSCTASQVLLELILNGIAPKAIILRDVDGLACVGALIAQEIFKCSDSQTPNIIHIGQDGYEKLWSEVIVNQQYYGSISSNGQLIMGKEKESLVTRLREAEAYSSSTVVQQKDLNHPFTKEEDRMLSESQTEAELMALNVLFRYAHIVSMPSDINTHQQTAKNPSYVSVSNAHIDGCTYIGPGGLQFVQHLVDAGGHVRVPTTLNSMSTDRRQWQSLGVPTDYATNAIELGDAYLALGCQFSFTCAPYLILNSDNDDNNESLFNQDVAWGESNAVVYANSVLGARTEKYADYLDICCAITGLAPKVGVHDINNRKPQIILDATEALSSIIQGEEEKDIDMLYPILGHLCGTLSDGQVPILLGLADWSDRITPDHLKSFCAAFGTTGSSPLIHIAGITPEAKDTTIVNEWISDCGSGRRTVTMEHMQETFETLDSDDGPDERVHLVALGNPHLSLSECEKLATMVRQKSNQSTTKKRKDSDIRIIACLSRSIQDQADELGHIKPLQDFGFEFINDTCWCMLLDPPVIPTNKNAKIMTNSGKYSHYGPGLTNRKFRFGSLSDCLQTAATGYYPKRHQQQQQQQQQTTHDSRSVGGPTWLTPKRQSFSTTATRAVRTAGRHILRFLK